MIKCNFQDVLNAEKLIFIESPVIYKVYDKFLDDLESDEDYQYCIVKDLINGVPRYLNDIIYGLSGYMGSNDWKELINNGQWYIKESEE